MGKDATSAARALAEENDIDINTLEGSGADGKITVDDVRQAMAHGSPTSEPKADDEKPTRAVERSALSEIVTVRIAQDVPHAVIAGQMMLKGETRQVTRLQLSIANKAHPGRFVVVGEAPAEDPEGKG